MGKYLFFSIKPIFAKNFKDNNTMIQTSNHFSKKIPKVKTIIIALISIK